MNKWKEDITDRLTRLANAVEDIATSIGTLRLAVATTSRQIMENGKTSRQQEELMGWTRVLMDRALELEAVKKGDVETATRLRAMAAAEHNKAVDKNEPIVEEEEQWPPPGHDEVIVK